LSQSPVASHAVTRRTCKVRLNHEITGELAEFLVDLRLKGRVSTYTEAVLRGLAMLQKEDLQMQMMKARLSSVSD